MKKMTVTQLARFAKDSNTRCSLSISGFSVDTRLTKPQEVFVALPGQQVDGHTFLGEAAAKGAIAAVVSKNYQGPDFGLPLIRVADGLQLLQDLAKHHLAKVNPRIVAVTGSIGKTTTKDFIGTLLKTKFKVGITPGNSNSQIGMPLAILNNFEGNEDIAVIEMGMTESGHISSLVRIAPPDVAVITSIALVHPCFFEGADEIETLGRIGLAKAEIFSHPKTQMGILNYEIPNFDQLRQNCVTQECERQQGPVQKRQGREAQISSQRREWNSDAGHHDTDRHDH